MTLYQSIPENKLKPGPIVFFINLNKKKTYVNIEKKSRRRHHIYLWFKQTALYIQYTVRLKASFNPFFGVYPVTFNLLIYNFICGDYLSFTNPRSLS